jgi:phage shock protein A
MAESKIEQYLVNLLLTYQKIGSNLWLLDDEEHSLHNVVIMHVDPFVIFRAEVMNSPKKNLLELYTKLLELNAADVVHGAYALENKKIVLLNTLQYDTMDYEDFRVTLDSFSFALTEHYPILSNVNDLISKSEKPEKMLNQLIIEMNEQLVDSKKAVAMAVAEEKKLDREKNNHLAQARKWERKAMLSVRNGKDNLAKEALLSKLECDNIADEYQRQWESQKISVDQLKESLRELQNEIDEAQRKKNLLIARKKRAEARQKIQNTISKISGNRSAYETFDNIDAKVDQIEADDSKELEDIRKNSGPDKRFADPEKSDTTAEALLLELKEKMKSLSGK